MERAQRHVWIGPCIALSAALIVAVGAVIAFEAYQSLRLEKRAFEPARFQGTQSYSAYAVIESVDLASNTMTALMRSPSAGLDLRVRFVFDESLVVEKQNAIVENGVVVGRSALEKASIADLQPGVRAIAVLRSSSDGPERIQYALIGDPFPHP